MIKVKSNKKLKIILLVLGMIFALATISTRNFSLVQVNDEVSLEDNNESQLRSASYDWDPQITRAVGSQPLNVFIGDANNDGLNDIVTTNTIDDDVSILLWNATLGDWDPQITRAVGNGPDGVFIGDANNDGLNDIVTTNNNDDDVSILLWNTTLGDWDPQITRPAGDMPRSVFIGDANNDAWNDIIVSNIWDNNVSILLWNATSGDWDPQITRTVGNGPYSVFIGDANNDAWNDIIVTNVMDNNVSMLLWNATSGDWDPQITRTVGNYPYGVFIGDANNDGYNDIATANHLSDDVSILLWNATSGVWDPQITRTVGNGPWSVFIGDADSDGLNDIVTANYQDDNVSILLWNATSGDWDPQITRTVGNGPRSVFIGDANNDAWNDIVASNNMDGNISILLWNPPSPIITIDTPENITYIESMSGYYPAVFGFENQLPGVMPNDWIIYGSSGTGYLRTVDELNGHKKVLDFYSGANGDSCYYEKNLKMNITNGTIEFWFQTTDVSPPEWYSWFMLSDGISESERNIRLCIQGDTLAFFNSSAFLLVDSIVPNQWYHLRIDFNMIVDTSTIYLNDVLKLSNVANYGNGSQINTIQVSNHYNLANTHLYLDAIGYSWDPHYNIGDNLEEGLLLSLENTTTIDWMGYSMDGQAIRTILGNATIPMPEDGPHTIQVFGKTLFGELIQSEIRHFSIDTKNPEIFIHSPNQYGIFGIIPPKYNISIVEANLFSSWYTLDSGTTNFTFTDSYEYITEDAWATAPNGSCTIEFFARDVSGKLGYKNITVVKDVKISKRCEKGFPIPLLITIIGVAGAAAVIIPIIILKKRKP